jgi:hypothetical protein
MKGPSTAENVVRKKRKYGAMAETADTRKKINK